MAYLTPGVYVEEKSSGEKPIAGVGTGTGGFIGIAEKGPIGEATLITNLGQYKDIFGGYVADGVMPYAVEQFFGEGGSKCYVVRTANYFNIDLSSSVTAVASSYTFNNGTNNIVVTAISPGVWGDSLSVELQAAGDATLAGGFKLLVKSGTTVLETYDNLTWHSLNAVNSSNYVKVTGASNPTVPSAGGSLTGGTNGNAVEIKDFTGSPASAAKNGLFAFDAIDEVNMIAMPDIHFLTTGVASDNIITGINKGLAYCEDRKDCFFIGDVPTGTSPADAATFKTTTGGFSSSYGAIYYPWIRSSFGGVKKYMPPSGAVMGVISRTDASRGVFKAPAGVIDGKVRTAMELEINVNSLKQEGLNSVGVNVIRQFAGPGNVIWGARTCSTGVDAEWHYINVRRYFMYVEESLDEGSQWVVFEPNTPALWGNVKRNITAFLMNEWRAGALFGNTAEEAFYVKVDAENNPPSIRNLGQLIIEVGIAPVKPAEFVIIRISQKTQEA